MAKKSEVSSGPGPSFVPPYEWWGGAAFKMGGHVISGELEEWPEAVKTSTDSRGKFEDVRIKRVPSRDTPGIVNDPKRFEIMLCLGERLAVVVPADLFVEAFLAVVPRWFWKPSDERTK